MLASKMAAATSKEDEDCYARQLRKHHSEVMEDRDELARIARLCKTDKRHVGFFIDAVDKNKFGIPTTERQPKCLSGLKRIKHKVTGVQFFKDDNVLLFQNLPDVPTGGNLTLTIIGYLFDQGYFKEATDVYINLDGASDNICYHVLYGMAHLLKCAAEAGWLLQRIHVLRFKVVIVVTS